jgi:hypothetical protein
MRPKKNKERRRKPQLTLIERRHGIVWMYLQIPVCAVLLLYLITLVR